MTGEGRKGGVYAEGSNGGREGGKWGEGGEGGRGERGGGIYAEGSNGAHAEPLRGEVIDVEAVLKAHGWGPEANGAVVAGREECAVPPVTRV